MNFALGSSNLGVKCGLESCTEQGFDFQVSLRLPTPLSVRVRYFFQSSSISILVHCNSLLLFGLYEREFLVLLGFWVK